MGKDPVWVAFFTIGVLLLGAGLYWFYGRRRFVARAQTALGKVVRLQEVSPTDGGAFTYAPVVQFKAANGQAVEFMDSFSSRPARYRAGESVSVLHDPDVPENARVAGAVASYLGPAIVMVIGLGFGTLGGLGMGMVDVVSNAIAPGRGSVGTLGGVWANEDVRTGGITRLEIRSRWPGIEVKMWGRCQPTDCDWGSPYSYDRSDVASGKMSLVWRPRFAVKNQELKLLPDGRLEIVTHTHFTDNSRRRDYDSKDYFRKVAAQ